METKLQLGSDSADDEIRAVIKFPNVKKLSGKTFTVS